MKKFIENLVMGLTLIGLAALIYIGLSSYKAPEPVSSEASCTKIMNTPVTNGIYEIYAHGHYYILVKDDNGITIAN